MILNKIQVQLIKLAHHVKHLFMLGKMCDSGYKFNKRGRPSKNELVQRSIILMKELKKMLMLAEEDMRLLKRQNSDI